MMRFTFAAGVATAAANQLSPATMVHIGSHGLDAMNVKTIGAGVTDRVKVDVSLVPEMVKGKDSRVPEVSQADSVANTQQHASNSANDLDVALESDARSEPSLGSVTYTATELSAEEEALSREILASLKKQAEEESMGRAYEYLSEAWSLARKGYVENMPKPIRSTQPARAYGNLEAQLRADGRDDDADHVARATELLEKIKLPDLSREALEEMRRDPSTVKGFADDLAFDQKAALFGLLKLAYRATQQLESEKSEAAAVLRKRFHGIVEAGAAVVACAIKGKSPEEIPIVLADSVEMVREHLEKSSAPREDDVEMVREHLEKSSAPREDDESDIPELADSYDFDAYATQQLS